MQHKIILLPAERALENAMEPLSLPSCLIANVLSFWIEVHDVVKLDTAYCNHELRPPFLAILRSPEVVLKETGSADAYNYPTDWLVWHTQRGVKASTISFAENAVTVPACVVINFIETVGGEHVSTFIFHDFSGDTQPFFSALSRNCQSLRILCVCNCGDTIGVEKVLRCCSLNLRSLFIAGSAFDCFEFFGLQLPSMKRLKLEENHGFNVAWNTETILRGCGALTEVILMEVEVSTACIKALERHAESLVRLDLQAYNPNSITVEALARLGQRCRNMRNLFLALPDDADAVVEAFVKTATKLDKLGLYGDVTNAQLSAVATQCGNRLRHLYVGVELATQTKLGFLELAKHCTALESLCCYYEGEHSYKDEFLQLIGAQKGLLSIDCGESVINDVYLETLATNCPLLQDIILVDSTGYTAAGMMRLIDGCKHLNYVQVGQYDPEITQLARVMWARINPSVTFIYADEPQRCWRYDALI
jgi:hypothetical protein